MPESRSRDAQLESEPAAGGPCCGGLSRRTLLYGAGAAVAVPVLAGCVSDNGGGGAAAPEAPTGREFPASEIPVGGGKLFIEEGMEEEGVVITQAEEGQFAAFSSVCTHQQCTVSPVITADFEGPITCGCHNSMFALADGSVVGGPATEPLPAFEISVDGDTITVA